MSVLALLPIVWLLVYLMTREWHVCSDKWATIDIKLRNMEDKESGMKVVKAYKDLRTKTFHAVFWLPTIRKTTVLSAGSQEDLEMVVDETYEELR